MLLEFSVIDKILSNLPKDVNKIIFDYYENKCDKCKVEYKDCMSCENSFHPFHLCFFHKYSSCVYCKLYSCPYQDMPNRKCWCDESMECPDCYYEGKSDMYLGYAENLMEELENTLTL